MSEDDHDNLSPEQDCELNGHVFEGYDTFSEKCSFCGRVRERVSRAGGAPADDLHVCWTAADHAFGLNGVCSLCGKTEDSLTPVERQQYAARRARNAE